jgi:N-methylhydantoinase B
VSLCAPVFADGKLFCWLSNAMHYQDVGGQAPGSQCVAAEDAFQEPPAWPPTRIVEQGRLRDDLEHLFVRQSRFPGLARMDLRAGLGAIEASRRRLAVLLARYGPDVVKAVMHGVLDAGEALFAERLAGIPDGRWSHRAWIEAALPGDRNTYAYQVNIEKAGDRLIVDNDGSDRQAGAINLTFAGFSGCVASALTQQMLPEQAGAYGGAYRRIEFRPVPGLINCADHPAAVSSSGVFATMSLMNVAATAVCKMLLSGDEEVRGLVLGAPTPNLASLIGAGLTAEGREFMLIDANGLIGSLAGRPARDGIDAGGQWWIPDATAQNSEDVEAQTPFLVLAREMLPVGADGAGAHRAGVGFREVLTPRGTQAVQVVVYQNESYPRGEGLAGGNPGSLATCRLRRDTDLASMMAAGALPVSVDDVDGDEPVLTFKGPPVMIRDGDVIEWHSPGAAGYGDPLARDSDAVLVDVREGMLTPAAAERVYGVRVTDAPAVDSAGTEALRTERRRERLGGREPGARVESPPGAHGVGEMLFVVEGRWWCNGADLGPQEADYREAAVVRDTPVREIGEEYESGDREIADRFVLREVFCPVTGFRVDAELQRV